MADDETTHAIISRQDAKALGLKRFFTGVECPNGHRGQRYVKCGACCKCLDGRRKKWRSENPEQGRELRRKWRRLNPERERKTHTRSNAKWWASAKEEINRKRREDRVRDPEPVREQRRASYRRIKERSPRQPLDQAAAWRAKNKEKWKQITQRARERWLAKFPDALRVHAHKRRAWKRGNGGTHTVEDIRQIRAMQRDRCAYCRKNMGRNYHIDHIIPVSKGGSNARSNIQILCIPCNLAKWSKDPIAYAREIGKLL